MEEGAKSLEGRIDEMARQHTPQTLPTDRSPLGIAHLFAGDAPPEGWLVCNGGAVRRAEYADLFAVIGEKFGSGDSATTFNLPRLSNAPSGFRYIMRAQLTRVRPAE